MNDELHSTISRCKHCLDNPSVDLPPPSPEPPPDTTPAPITSKRSPTAPPQQPQVPAPPSYESVLAFKATTPPPAYDAVPSLTSQPTTQGIEYPVSNVVAETPTIVNVNQPSNLMDEPIPDHGVPMGGLISLQPESSQEATTLNFNINETATEAVSVEREITIVTGENGTANEVVDVGQVAEESSEEESREDTSAGQMTSDTGDATTASNASTSFVSQSSNFFSHCIGQLHV